MRFNVPKFIDVEDKIFGPLTFKQFVYLVGGAGMCVVALWLIPGFILALPVMGAIAALSLALAFWNYNGKPFIHIVQAIFVYLTNTRTYVWKRQRHDDKSKEQMQKELKQIEKSITDAHNDTITQKSVSVEVGDEGPQTGNNPRET
jgi:membrane protein implicated in regulation of membrane protease activity